MSLAELSSREMTFCHECGAKIAPDDPFCGNCGAAQVSVSATSSTIITGGHASAPASAPEPTASQLEDTESPDREATEATTDNSSTSVAESASAEPVANTETPAPVVEHDVQHDAQMKSTFAPSDENVSAQSAASENKQTGELAPGNGGASATATARTGSTGGRQPAVKQLEAGAVLNGRYEVVRRIGGGGMGAVYLAKDRNLGDAPRAVKEMIESHLDDAQHEKAIADFKRESLLLTELEHPSIPTVYDYFYEEESERFYLVMKFIPGSDLASRLRASPGGRIDELTVTEWGMQVADVLHYLHTRPQPIIYRDLKPANLMFDSNLNRIMLIDFGIARWVNKKEKGVTAVGTMGYAPPELFSGQADPRVDIYSLGATMFHLVTGSDPQDNPLLIFDFTKNPRPRQINPQLSSEIEQLLTRAVEYKPEYRFQSGAEMRDALAAHLEKLRSGQVSYGAPAQELGGETLRVAIVFCGFCGGRIAADDVFCAHCGSRQPMAGTDSSPRLVARPTAKLIVAGTTELDASFNLQKDSNLVGRTDPLSNIFPEVDLSRFDPQTKVSRRHARIWRKGEAYMVEDLGSVNGTVINDIIRLEPRQPRPLDSGDRIKLGETTLHFLVG